MNSIITGETTSSVTPLVSIMIPTWNRRDELDICLNSLSQQSYAPIEIVIADDASTDGTLQMLSARQHPVVIIEGKEQLGPYYRRNQVILRSAGKYILSLDSDVEFEDAGLIERLVAAMEFDERISELGGEFPVHLGERSRASGLRFSKSWYAQRVWAHPTDGKVACEYLATCFCIFRRDDALSIGGFDPYYRFGGADADFGIRLAKVLEKRNYVGYDFSVAHRASEQGRRPDATFRYCVSRLRMIAKFGGMARLMAQFTWDMFTFGRRAIHKGAGKKEWNSAAKMYVRAYVITFRQWRNIIGCRKRNFLSDEEMRRFAKGRM